MKRLLLLAIVVFAGVSTAACSADPIYVQPPRGLEVGTGMDGDTGVATELLALPFDLDKLMSVDYQRERVELLTELNARVDPDVAEDQLPLVRLDQLDVSIEWSIRNLADEPGQARIRVNGANQYYLYVPTAFVVDPEEDEEPPPLAGNIPIAVPPQGTVSGVFREDQLREAAVDLELITRGGLNPFAAMLNVHEDIQSTADVPYVAYPPDQDPPPAAPPPLPIEAFGHLVQIEMTFQADRHMVLEYTVRVRDPDELLHDELLAADPAELMVFMPAAFAPAGIAP